MRDSAGNNGSDAILVQVAGKIEVYYLILVTDMLSIL